MMSAYDFSAVRSAMRRFVDTDILPGVSRAVLVGRELVELDCTGWADKEANLPLRRDHIFRVFSNTKLVTSCAALLLLEEGRFALDDPVARYIPQFANRRVLRPDATGPEDAEPAAGAITIRHLMSHSSGLSYGLFDPGTLIHKRGKGYGLAGAVTVHDAAGAVGELEWGGVAGTHWWIAPGAKFAGRLMTQRQMAFWHPFSFEFKRLVYRMLGAQR